jgi:hypothetical protein
MIRRNSACAALGPGKFYKRRSQEKTLLYRLDFFLLRSPLDGAGSVLNSRAMCSVAGRVGPAVWVFSTSGFHRFFANEAARFRNQQSRISVKFGDHSSIWDSWPIAFSGYPRGPRVACETRCPKHAAPNLSAETRSLRIVSSPLCKHTLSGSGPLCPSMHVSVVSVAMKIA